MRVSERVERLLETGSLDDFDKAIGLVEELQQQVDAYKQELINETGRKLKAMDVAEQLQQQFEWKQVTDSNKPLPVPRMVYDKSCKRSKITMLKYEVNGTWWRELCASDYPPAQEGDDG